MPKRKTVGTENLVGQNVVLLHRRRGMRQTTLLSQLQVRGIDIGQSALSALEGQNRKVSYKELVAIADALDVSVEELFHPKSKKSAKL